MFRTKHEKRETVVGAPTASSRRSRNLAARMGRWSAAHWKTATFGWLAFVVVAFVLGGMVGTKTIDPNTPGPGESGRMDRILDAGFKQPAGESVLIQSRALRTNDPAFTAAIEDVVASISRLDAVQNVRSPLEEGNAGQISKNGHAALVEFEIRGDADKAIEKIDPVLDRVAELQRAHPGFFIGEFGDASAVDAIDTALADDLEKAGVLSLPITLIILVITFGALVAAGIPLLLALTAVFATFGLIALPSHILPVASQAPAIVLLIGLAVGVDYSMFYLRREREERAAGRSERAALEAAAATSGRSVLISGLTVMTAMAGMFLTGDGTFASFGVATILVVAVAVLGSLTVLPALLLRLGDKVDRLRVPLVGQLRRDDGEGRIWGGIVDGVLRRPVLSAVLAGGLLVALAVPALQLRMVNPGPDTFPQSLPVVKTYNRMQQAFPGSALPASVVVKAPNVNASAVREAIDQLRQRALASGRMHEPITVDVNEDATVANITVPIDGKGADAESNASLTALRDELVPTTVGALPNAESGVTGLTAIWKDSTDEMKSKLPLVVAFVLLFAFALMLFAFRSLVIAAKAILLNLLSVAAAYGVLVLVFQHGIGQGLLGFSSTAGIDPVVPLLLFVILFGLSMDYHVFLLSRIREAVQRGAATDEAIAHGIKSTAGVVTSAAIVMVAVFAVFATLSMLIFKQFGVGLATAILIDATIVRGVLLPATMKLLGEWNWYVPRWLHWLPQLEHHEPEPEPEPTPEVKRAPGRIERKRVFTPARIAALALIGALVIGLAYLRFAPDDRVSVPAGAKAGDLTLHPCSYATEAGSHAADCGTLVVPENRADPQSRLIALPVTRIRATSDDPKEPIFRLEGGPGITNMKFKNASRFADNHDVVLVGYRGVDGSSVLDCPEVESALKHSTDFVGEKSFRAYGDALRSCADRLTDDGVDLAGYTLAQRVDDLEAARIALGYDRIDLLSESAGTRTAMIYSWRYPRSIHRSVMIAVNPPGGFLWDAKTTDEQIGRYADLCSEDGACSKRTDDLAASMGRTAADMPDRWFFLPIKEGNVRVASFYGLMESTSENAPLSAPMTLSSWLSAADGDASGFWFMSLLADFAFPQSFVWGEYAATARADAQAARDYFSSGRRERGSNLGRAATSFGWGGGRLTDGWPAAPDEGEYSRVRTSNVETLLIGGALDFATPPQVATKELLPYLPNGHQVVLAERGHTTDFWTQQPEASSRLINTFFDSGRIDDSLYKPASVDFTPEVTQTALGKGLAGAMVGLALLTVLSLLWMVRRVHKRGRFGRKAGVTLRSLYPIVLGLGGWFLGALLVITTMPGVPLDNELLAVLSVGVPIGLGIYWAWVHRDWSATSKTAGFVGAMGGALIGGWLGIQATDGLLALITTIAGAAGGANLVLIALGMTWERSIGSRFASDAEATSTARHGGADRPTALPRTDP
jgi:uncharacterized membrane protein YdfJ with MMPL/SSD domain/pimeloyl-ACP methyl ester carboxylesterase